MSSSFDASPDSALDFAISELRDKSTPPYLDQLLDEMTIRAVVQTVDPSEPHVEVGGFQLINRVGTGGYGCVIEARDPELGRPVALKLCATNKPGAEELLMAEARVLAQLSHPNIITIHDTGRYGDADEGLFLVMEYASDGSLAQSAVKGERMSWRELVPIFADVARGLAAAHDAGVVHGDVKPSNILLHADGRPRVADFGLARIIGAPTLLPKAIGTLIYAAPEGLRGAELDPRSDQWSLFVALWECLDQRLPFMSKQEFRRVALKLTEADMLEMIERWPGPSALESTVPKALREVLRVGLALDPSKRFPDMHAVAAALDRVVAGDDPSSRVGWKGALTALVLVTGLGLAGEAYVLSTRVPPDAESPVPTDEQPAPRHPSEAAASVARGEQQLLAAIETAKILDPNSTDADLYDLYDQWQAGWELVAGRNLARASELTLLLANAVDTRAPGNVFPARLASKVAHQRSTVGDLDGAIAAQERAVTLAEKSDAAEQLAVARSYLAKYRKEQAAQQRQRDAKGGQSETIPGLAPSPH